MQFSMTSIIEALVLASALSMDAFVASFAYGTNKIKIPFLSIQVINVVCSVILGVTMLIGTLIRQYIPERLTVIICFVILFTLGIVKLLDSLTKTIIRKYTNIESELKFSMFNFKFILRLYADPEKADVNHSKVISPGEAASLAVALSLDGIAVGFGAAIGSANCIAVLIWSLLTDALAVFLGCYIGNQIARKFSFNLSWLSGVLLITLAILKLF